jgi:hypothetical protein
MMEHEESITHFCQKPCCASVQAHFIVMAMEHNEKISVTSILPALPKALSSVASMRDRA